MRLILVCVGRSKAGPEKELASRYLERAAAAGRSLGFTGIEIREIDESRARRPEDRKLEEAKAISVLLGTGAKIIAFDETGKTWNSGDFAGYLGDVRDRGTSSLGLVIGGPDGLDADLRAKASAIVAFGAMTWPHQLVRIMAAEQIYRAITILAGHPYHRT
jgi:23S rRNA (pseudouridine1915-N3)-methyltransferase